MKLYYSKGACSLVVRIVINEIGLQCDYESVDLKSKKTEKGTDFFSINPKGAVPALEISDKKILTENSVIQQYLADSNNATNLLPAINNFERYRVLEWVNYISTEIHKTFGPLFNADVPAEVKKDIFIPLLQKKFGFTAKNLSTKKYMLGDTFTLPDAICL